MSSAWVIASRIRESGPGGVDLDAHGLAAKALQVGEDQKSGLPSASSISNSRMTRPSTESFICFFAAPVRTGRWR